jgi:hypothetical protein
MRSAHTHRDSHGEFGEIRLPAKQNHAYAVVLSAKAVILSSN